MRVRKDVWKLASTDDTLHLYAVAVARMKKKPISDPTSWWYQAAIHGYPFTPLPQFPNQLSAMNASSLPPAAELATYWCQCQHYSWFFLPWHRAYLFYFEQIVAQTIADLSGASGWTLPYWNYCDLSNANAQLFPTQFTGEHLPDGTENTLWVAGRRDWTENGTSLRTQYPSDIDLTNCHQAHGFPMGPGGVPLGFGGGTPGMNHAGGTPGLIAGVCEGGPHAAMHTDIGGWMQHPDTAPLDPIFWLHHANIDRLWEVWRRQKPSQPGDFTNPKDSCWLSEKFDFHDALGAPVSITVEQIIDSTRAPLNYQYEGLSHQSASNLYELPVDANAPEETPSPASWRTLKREKRNPEMIGATDPSDELVLTHELITAGVDLRAPTGPSAKKISERYRHYYLMLENVTAEKSPVSNFKVYVDLPEGPHSRRHPELFAGLVAGFGLVEASDPKGKHGKAGLNYVFEITKIVAVLRDRGSWNATELHVSFTPEEADAEPESELVRVGRVSVHVA